VKIRLLAVIGHDDLRNSLHDLFSWAGDICMAAVATSAEECMEHLQDNEFDGLLLDTAHASEIRGLLDRLHEKLDRLPILALCPGNIPPLVVRALNNGATTCIDKEADPLSILASIRTAVKRHTEKSSGA
jgi:DNA-binding NarL/FixJ family response regulator